MQRIPSGVIMAVPGKSPNKPWRFPAQFEPWIPYCAVHDLGALKTLEGFFHEMISHQEASRSHSLISTKFDT
jgi:hypothetical protein